MATLREAIYAVLEADAKLHTGTELGSLLGKWATAPYGIYLSSPPAEPDLPFITYYIGQQADRLPRSIFLFITAWSKTNWEAILQRIYALLHDTQLTATDYSVKMIKWNWASPEMMDDDLKTYYCQHRFEIKGVKV